MRKMLFMAVVATVGIAAFNSCAARKQSAYISKDYAFGEKWRKQVRDSVMLIAKDYMNDGHDHFFEPAGENPYGIFGWVKVSPKVLYCFNTVYHNCDSTITYVTEDTTITFPYNTKFNIEKLYELELL